MKYKKHRLKKVKIVIVDTSLDTAHRYQFIVVPCLNVSTFLEKTGGLHGPF